MPGLTLDDMGVIEVNEAFASVVLQTASDLELEERMDDVNPNGGGISLGHPLGATGARITATLLNELERRNARYGIASMCVGFGMAIAGVVRSGCEDRSSSARRDGLRDRAARGRGGLRHGRSRGRAVAGRGGRATGSRTS